jgi:CheY-like chemotaxis protein
MLSFQDQRNLPTVLLIDDDLVSREVMATVLTMSGYTVHTADGGAPSLKLLADRKCNPDVILMDAQMPGLSGTQLIHELRAHSHASIYAISGSHAPEAVVAAADGFLLKPFGADALNKLLKEHAPPAKHQDKAFPAAQPSRNVATELIADEPIVHAETLAQLRAIMPDTAVRQIFAAIVADLAKRLPALQLAIASGNHAEIRRIGHSIKGGCGMAGARQVARLGALLESDSFEAKGNHLDNSSQVLADLRAATEALERMLEKEFPA